MVFGLQNLVSAPANLNQLEAPFTDGEINSVVGDLPSGKAPGPDGFNTNFIKNASQLSLRISTTYVWAFMKEIFACKV